MYKNSSIHHRRSIRIKGYDYSSSGMYFVTICCKDMLCRFGKISNFEMVFNDFGKIAFDEWQKLSERYSNLILNVFQVMPNHIHGIIVLENAGTQNADIATVTFDSTAANSRAGASPAPTIGNIVGAYKSLVANRCLKICKSNNEQMYKLWQRDYFEHIIRNDAAYKHIAEYIINNPANWKNDKYYT